MPSAEAQVDFDARVRHEVYIHASTEALLAPARAVDPFLRSASGKGG